MKDKELLEVLNRNIDFIKQADTKAAFASTVLFVIVGYLISKASLYTDSPDSLILLLLLLIMAALITLLTFESVFPTIKNNLSNKSNIYFGSITSKTFKQWSREAEAMKPKDYHAELKAQVYVTSEITSKKMVGVKKTIIWLLVFIALSGISTVLVKLI